MKKLYVVFAYSLGGASWGMGNTTFDINEDKITIDKIRWMADEIRERLNFNSDIPVNILTWKSIKEKEDDIG